jgi:hypothetical protein
VAAALAVLLVVVVAGCSASRPSRPRDLCAVFAENPEWYRAARDSYRRWRVPIPLQLAVIYHESGFDAEAQPPRSRILGIFPGPRASSAYGYGQAIDGTWDWYRESTGRGGADRDDFDDVVDFIGWYGATGERSHGIPRDDPYSYYLAYHEGHAGYLRGSFRRQPAVRRAASAVMAQSQRYERQLRSCRSRLESLY